MTNAKEVYGYVDSIKLVWGTVPSDLAAEHAVPEEAVVMSMVGRPSCVRTCTHVLCTCYVLHSNATQDVAYGIRETHRIHVTTLSLYINSSSSSLLFF